MDPNKKAAHVIWEFRANVFFCFFLKIFKKQKNDEMAKAAF